MRNELRSASRLTVASIAIRRILRAAAIAAIIIILGQNRDAEAAMVTLYPGANLQNAVNSNPPGTTFLLQHGVYRGQSVLLQPKTSSGDSFIGQGFVDLDGGVILKGWTMVTRCVPTCRSWTSIITLIYRFHRSLT